MEPSSASLTAVQSQKACTPWMCSPGPSTSHESPAPIPFECIVADVESGPRVPSPRGIRPLERR